MISLFSLNLFLILSLLSHHFNGSKDSSDSSVDSSIHPLSFFLSFLLSLVHQSIPNGWWSWKLVFRSLTLLKTFFLSLLECLEKVDVSLDTIQLLLFNYSSPQFVNSQKRLKKDWKKIEKRMEMKKPAFWKETTKSCQQIIDRWLLKLVSKKHTIGGRRLIFASKLIGT